MLASLKFRLLQWRSCLCRAWMIHRHGVQIGQRGYVHGLPRLRRHKKARIELGNDVTLNSSGRLNPLVTKAVTILALTEQARVHVSDHVGLSGVHIVCRDRIEIGEYTVVGPDTVLYDSSVHEYDEELGWSACTRQRVAPIIIGKKCYIGMRCVILRGVSIGDRCVIAAGTVVDKDVPAGHIARGNPMVITPLPANRGGQS